MANDIDLNALQAFMQSQVPFWQTLGLELKEVSPGRAVFEGEVRDNLLQNGILHGGVLASIADSACAVAAISRINPAGYATTISLRVSYLKPVIQGKFRAEGVCIKAGKTIQFAEAEVWNDRGETVCKASSELMMLAAGEKGGGPHGGDDRNVCSTAGVLWTCERTHPWTGPSQTQCSTLRRETSAVAFGDWDEVEQSSSLGPRITARLRPG